MRNGKLLTRKLVLLNALLLFQLCACKKVSVVKRNEVRLYGTYRLTSARVVRPGNGPLELAYPLNQSQLQDTYTFLPNGSFAIRGVETLAGGTDPDDNGTWSTQGATLCLETEMQGARQLEILHHDARTLVLAFAGEYEGSQARFVSTFERQD